jgi:uncharacterized protein YecE (DUF72 family)
MAKRVRVRAFAGGAPNSQEITHEQNRVGAEDEVEFFLNTIAELGDRLGPLLLQLPPSFDVEGMGIREDFLERLPGGFRYAVEVRHRSWLGPTRDAARARSDQNHSSSALERFLKIRRGER